MLKEQRNIFNLYLFISLFINYSQVMSAANRHGYPVYFYRCDLTNEEGQQLEFLGKARILGDDSGKTLTGETLYEFIKRTFPTEYNQSFCITLEERGKEIFISKKNRPVVGFRSNIVRKIGLFSETLVKREKDSDTRYFSAMLTVGISTTSDIDRRRLDNKSKYFELQDKVYSTIQLAWMSAVHRGTLRGIPEPDPKPVIYRYQCAIS